MKKSSSPRLSYVASDRPQAQDAEAALSRLYGSWPIEKADVVIALGGDGTMLDTLRRVMDLQQRQGRMIPVYGMNCGTIGFLMNGFAEDDLLRRIETADHININPLRMVATDLDGKVHEAMAFNEIALLRETRQTAKITIKVHGRVRMPTLICDGVLLSTPAGSTAYNFSAHGPILPISADLLALTPISPFRPRRWRGALLSYGADVEFIVQDAEFRRVLVTADSVEVREVQSVKGQIADDVTMCLLFDQGEGLEERVLDEQFATDA